MSDAAEKRHLVENEVVFRQHNERVRSNFDEIKRLAQEAGQEYLIPNDDSPLHFYCECSDENCKKRILMKPSVYHRIHKNRKQFVLVCGHETKLIEQVVRTEDKYCIVEKFNKPPETARKLAPTGVDNS
jgi:hypothetical protein